MEILKFSAKWCGQCKTLTTLLNDNKIPYTEVDIEDEANEELIAKYKVRALPLLIIKNKEFEKKLIGIPSINSIKEAITEANKV